MTRSEQNEIIDSITNGQWAQAKALIEYRCKTIPQRLAFRLANIVGVLCDREQWSDAKTLTTMYKA